MFNVGQIGIDGHGALIENEQMCFVFDGIIDGLGKGEGLAGAVVGEALLILNLWFGLWMGSFKLLFLCRCTLCPSW